MANALPHFVEAPQVTPLPYGLHSVSVVEDDAAEAVRWLLGGIIYEPVGCADVSVTDGPCSPLRALGEASVSVGTTRNATLTLTDAPATTPTQRFEVRWGDEEPGEGASVLTGDTASHTYVADDTYQVEVTGPDGYLAQVAVVVTNGTATGPFDVQARSIIAPTQSGIPRVVSAPTVVYAEFACNAVGVTAEEREQRAADALRLNEQRATEVALAARLAADTDAVDITPAGGAVSTAVGLALLEQHAAALYGATPVVHAPRAVGSLLATEGAVVRGSSRLETVQGAYVASGAGYYALRGPGGVEAGDGQAWLWITGATLVHRAGVIGVNVIDGAPYTNTARSLAQRPVVAAYECLAAAVLVTLAKAGE